MLPARIEYCRARIEYCRARIEYCRARIEYCCARIDNVPNGVKVASVVSAATLRLRERADMPHIALTMYQGRDEETKRDIAQKIETFYRETFGFGENEVSVSIIDSAPEEYSAAVEGRFTEQEQLVIPSKFIGGQA